MAAAAVLAAGARRKKRSLSDATLQLVCFAGSVAKGQATVQHCATLSVRNYMDLEDPLAKHLSKSGFGLPESFFLLQHAMCGRDVCLLLASCFDFIIIFT